MNCFFLSSRTPDLIRNSKLLRFYFIPCILRDCLLKHHFPFGILPRSVSGMFLYCFLNINKCLSKFNCIWFDGLTPNWHNCTLLCIGIRILMNWDDGRLEANQETALAQVLAFEFSKTPYNFNSIILDVKVAKSRCLKVWQLSNNCTAYHYVVLSISLEVPTKCLSIIRIKYWFVLFCYKTLPKRFECSYFLSVIFNDFD